MAEYRNQRKIKNLDELVPIISQLKGKGKIIVHCHGVFDLLHPGHIRHFEAAKREGDILVVTITQDKHVAKGPGRPVFNEHLRAESVAALQVVDYVAINQWPTAVETIRKLKPDVYCKGSDYADAKEDLSGNIVNEEEAIRSVGGRIHFTEEITFSSTKLINLHFDVLPEEARGFVGGIRDTYSSSEIIELLQKLRSMKVLVIGDTIIDEYHLSNSSRCRINNVSGIKVSPRETGTRNAGPKNLIVVGMRQIKKAAPKPNPLALPNA